MVSSGVSCDSACRHPPFRVVATTYQHPLVRTRAMHGLWLTHPRRNASGGVPPYMYWIGSAARGEPLVLARTRGAEPLALPALKDPGAQASART